MGVDEDTHLSGVYGVQSSPLTHGHSDPDIISTLYARMLIAETMQLPTRADCWSADVGLSPSCRSLGVDSGMSVSGGSSAETGSFVFGPGGAGGVLTDLYNNEDDDDDDDNHNCWDAFSSGFFDGNLSARHLRAGLGAAAGDDAGTSAGPWRLKPDVGVSAVIGGGSCGSDGATSPSSSPAESSTGSAA